MRAFLLAAAATLSPTPALAQDSTPPQTYEGTGQADGATAIDNPSLDADRDTLTIGVGAVVLPDYEGSNDYRFLPGAVVRGKVSGVSFFSRGLALFVDLVPEATGQSVDVSVGPMIQYRGGRNDLDSIDDRRVRALGETDTSLELGGWIGIAKTGVVTSDYDTVSARVTFQHDVIGGHDSFVVTPSVEYGTPLSTKLFVGIGASAEYVGRGFAREYYRVSPAQSLASGLPVYDLDDGFKSIGVNTILGYSLSGDLRRGWGLFALGGYSRQLGEFGDAPIVRIAGDRDQWFGALGIGYTF